ncbi:MAG: ATP-binding protein [Verrucomicrobiota bacterium]
MQNESTQNLKDDFNAKEALRQCSGCAVVAIDAAGKIILLTSEAAKRAGISSPSDTIRSIEQLPEPLRKIVGDTLSCREPRHLETSQGGLNILIQVTPTLDQMGNCQGAVAVLHDLSSLETIEKNLERMDRLASIGTLSASMAHEIKNALVAVKTFIDLLLSRNEHDELAGIVGREMTRIDSIVSQMLKFSGPAKPILSPLHLHDVLNHSLHLVQHQIDQKQIQLERRFDAAPDLVKGDDYQLKQAFLNLFLNALEATPALGKLTVSTNLMKGDSQVGSDLEHIPGQLRVAIRDSGVGIAPENLRKVFEPFFTTKPRGTGLGLAITRRIIHEHRATIAVESTAGEGAEFSIFFPISRKNS